MSTWIRVENPEDVELSEDGRTVEVLYSSDKFGNNYIEIPVEFVNKVLSEKREDHG